MANPEYTRIASEVAERHAALSYGRKMVFRKDGTGDPVEAEIVAHVAGERWAAVLLGPERQRKIVLAADLREPPNEDLETWWTGVRITDSTGCDV